MSMVRPLSPTHLGDVKTAAMRAIEGYANRLHGRGRRTDGERSGLKNRRNLTLLQILHYQDRH